MPKAKFKTSKSGCSDLESSDDEFGAFWGTSSMVFRSHQIQVNINKEDQIINAPSIIGREFVRMTSNQLTNDENSMSQGNLPDLCQKFPSGLFSPSKKLSNQTNETNETSRSVENDHFEDYNFTKTVFQNSFSSDFSHSSEFKEIGQTHKEEKKFRCNMCQKSFTHPSNLTNHIRTHTSEKPFECEICPKKFSQKGNLKRHMLTHTGELPFECDKCEKVFARKDNLKAHMLTHTGELSFECDNCEKAFARKDKLKAHMLTHTVKNPS